MDFCRNGLISFDQPGIRLVWLRSAVLVIAIAAESVHAQDKLSANLLIAATCSKLLHDKLQHKTASTGIDISEE